MLRCAVPRCAAARGMQDGGWGLHEILKTENWKLRGIVNGIDYQEWSPQVDEFLKVSEAGCVGSVACQGAPSPPPSRRHTQRGTAPCCCQKCAGFERRRGRMHACMLMA